MSEKRTGKTVYIKVDGAQQLIADVLFNDESEHQFQIQCHMLTLDKNDLVSTEAEDRVISYFI